MLWGALPLKATVPLPCVKVPLFKKFPVSERDPVPLLNVPALMVNDPNDLEVAAEKARVPELTFVKS